MTPFYSLLVVAVLFFSCKKDEESELWTEVHVTATNYVTGEPINDVIVGVYERKTKSFLKDSEVEILKEDVLVNGKFDFGWKAKKSSKYSYEFAAVTDFEKYYKISMTQFAYLDEGEVHNYEFSLVPKAYMRLGYKNTSLYDSNDAITIYRPNIDIPDYYGWSANPSPYFGYQDVLTSFSLVPIGRYHWEWHITKNNVTTVYHDTMTLN